MTFWGELENGAALFLGEPLEARLLYDQDAPASQLQALFALEEPWGDLAYVRAYREGQVVFGGIVDEQNTFLDGDGVRVELVCRSWEGILLDNEAQPGVLQNPSLAALERRFLNPLGFSQARGDRSPQTGQWAVEKGTSCWEVLEGFCREFLGTSPYVDGEGGVHCEGAEEVVCPAGPVLSAQLSRSPCRRLSAVWQQSYRGSYDTPFRNAAFGGAPRQRYVSMEDGRDPRELIREGEREYRLLTVELPGDFWPRRGQAFTVEAPRLGRFSGWQVRSARYEVNGQGERTRLVLEEGEASCGWQNR